MKAFTTCGLLAGTALLAACGGSNAPDAGSSSAASAAAAPAPAVVSVPPADPARPWAGVWETNEGRITLAQTGAEIRGTYPQDDGRLEGRAEGRVFEGYWVETDSNERCETARQGSHHWGRARFEMTEAGDAFEGRFSRCDAEPDSTWSGRRIAPDAAPAT